LGVTDDLAADVDADADAGMAAIPPAIPAAKADAMSMPETLRGIRDKRMSSRV
jgi:hypothetical protein